MNNKIFSDGVFRQQIKEDIKLIQENLSWDPNTGKDEYAFNYWVLSNIYSLDEEGCNGNITDYNDKGIDCFVHYEEDKELYIIQNKYYGENTKLDGKEISDFLTRPIATLESDKYTRSPELQNIYNQIKDNNEYQIFLHFYVTSNNKNNEHEDLVRLHNNSHATIANIFYLDDIKEKYYGGKSYKEGTQLSISLNVQNKASYLAIRPQEYKLPHMSEAYYVMASVFDIYQLWKKSKENDYELFEENIREYLGKTSSINKNIIETLRDDEEKGKFFYYSNGITIICEKADADSQKVNIENPQIVNGCQTVNSIAEVLKNADNAKKDFKDTFVMTKVLVLKTAKQEDKKYYRDIVKYTNSQSAISEKVFGAARAPFFKIQDNLKKKGLLLLVKQSDKNKFSEDYADNTKSLKLIEIANKQSTKDFHQFNKLTDVQIPLETLIQIIGAFEKDAYFSYVKKALLLKPNNQEYHQNFSMEIGNLFTADSMAKLIVFYKKSASDKGRSDDRKTPIPYYLLNFLGHYLYKKNINKQKFLEGITIEDLATVYTKFKPLTKHYYEMYKSEHGMEYNQMIKQKVDRDIMGTSLNEMLVGFQEHNPGEYEKFTAIFEKASALGK